MKNPILSLFLLTSLAFCNIGNAYSNDIQSSIPIPPPVFSRKYENFFPNEKSLMYYSYSEGITSAASVLSGDDFFENKMVLFDSERNGLIYLIDYKEETSVYGKDIKEIKDNSLELLVFYDFNFEKYIYFSRYNKLKKDEDVEELFRQWDILYNRIRKVLPEKEQYDYSTMGEEDEKDESDEGSI